MKLGHYLTIRLNDQTLLNKINKIAYITELNKLCIDTFTQDRITKPNKLDFEKLNVGD